MQIDFVKKDKNGVVQDTATFLVQPNKGGGVVIHPITHPIPNTLQVNHLNNADAEAHLDTFFPQPPWQKIVTP